jgi:RimJ/RimL family protein N-acetyltransferase
MNRKRVGMNQQMQGAVGEMLPDDVLAWRSALPLKVAPVTLTGRFVQLEPYDPARDLDALFAVSNGEPAALGDRVTGAYDADALIWRYMFGGPFEDVAAMAAYMRGQHEAQNGLCLTVFDTATDQQVGICNYMTNMPEHLKIELGSIWYSPLVQRTNANTEATCLMLEHAFGLGYRRVEWKCDSLNERSRRAALRMGFQFEGIQDAHFIIKNRNRDTAWYRVLDHEWPDVKRRLIALLGD